MTNRLVRVIPPSRKGWNRRSMRSFTSVKQVGDIEVLPVLAQALPLVLSGCGNFARISLVSQQDGRGSGDVADQPAVHPQVGAAYVVGQRAAEIRDRRGDLFRLAEPAGVVRDDVAHRTPFDLLPGLAPASCRGN